MMQRKCWVKCNKEHMSKNIKRIITFDVLLFVLWMLFLVLYYKYSAGWMESTYITLFTVFYHFTMRLIVGETVTLIYKKREFNQESVGFKLHAFEKKLYNKIGVKQWKKHAITAKPEQFDMKSLSPQELLHNVMQAELVHRLIFVLSYVPLLFIIPFGAPVVFVATSVVASCIDLKYVIIQRYNRPRVIRMLNMMEKRRME